MNWGIFVVQTQPDKFFVFERQGVYQKISGDSSCFKSRERYEACDCYRTVQTADPNGKTRFLFQTSSLSMIKMRYPLFELLEMPGFFAEMPFMSEPMIVIEVGPKP
jgi:hypothetical protein